MMYYKKRLGDIYRELESSENGLSDEKAGFILRRDGSNELTEKKSISPFTIFINQFRSFLIVILIAATVLSILLGEIMDAVVILIILVLNAILGFVQEYRAEKSIEALKKLAGLKARVIRNSKEILIDSKNLVRGDIILLEEGNKISADARLIEVNNFKTQEASLTGESTAVTKSKDIIDKDVPVADQKNMVFSGTIVTRGNAKAIITATGMKTEIGKIAKLIDEAENEPTPLQTKLAELGRWLGIAIIIICTIVFFTGLLKGEKALPMLMASISLAVAAVPEGLPAVVTISLALGIQKMVKRNAIIRKLPSVDTLGCTTVICTDKTGTLTCNEMMVEKIYVNHEEIDVSGTGYSAKGRFSKRALGLSMLLKIGVLCNNAKLKAKNIIGDPTEAALLVSGLKKGVGKETLEKTNKRVYEIPFESERKLMTTINDSKEGRTAYTKGAPDVILDLCTYILVDGRIKPMAKEDRRKILEANERFAKKTLRVLGFAYKEVIGDYNDYKEKKLIFVGLQAMMDPPREEVKEAIKKCHSAGIKVVMITGDYKLTAEAIAKEIGIKGRSVSSDELDKIKDLKKVVDDIAIYSRVNPEHKMRIVDALQDNGHVVAMGGDGVNDAPALKEADIGIAMGITGTDVAKEASDMVLTDDNFTSIVNAVEEGRGTYDNIKKFVNYMLSTNLAEVLLIFIASLIFTKLPLVAIQILWLNLVTDGLPAIALGVDPSSRGIMKRVPRKRDDDIVSKKMSLNIVVTAIIISIATLTLFGKWHSIDLDKARTIAFTTIVVLEIVRVYMVRSQYDIRFFSNKYLFIAISSSIMLQLLVVYTPKLNIIFRTVPLGLIEWVYIFTASVSVLIASMMARKVINRFTEGAE